MSNDKSWQKPLDNFLAESNLSADTRVLARVLSNDNELKNEQCNNQQVADMEQALHIEQHLDEIGLQPIPASLTSKLQQISKPVQRSNVIFGKFKSNWIKMGAIAATVTAVVLLNSITLNPPMNQQPTLAEIKHAQQELTLALQYVSLAKVKSAHKIKQTFDENIQQPLNQSLFKPLNHFKETS
jgi:hypothetical protein